jgi:hypothetical protein
VNKFKQSLKEMFLTKEGWISWIIANTITSLPWFLPLAYGFVFKDNTGYLVASAIYAFILLPLTPFWILNVIIAVWFKNILLKTKSVIIVEGDNIDGK